MSCTASCPWGRPPSNIWTCCAALRPAQEAQQSTFTVQNPEKEALGLRFDLTVPLARVVAQYRDLPRPFRRYQVSPVWRADKPGRGRFREFTQFDLDSVGVESEVADTEVIAGMCDTLRALKVGPFQVRFSSRGILNVLLAFAGIPEGQGPEVFRVLDKLDKVGPQKVRLELTVGYVDSSGDPIPGVGLDSGPGRPDRALPRDPRGRSPRGGGPTARPLRRPRRGGAGALLVERISSHLFALGYGGDQVFASTFPSRRGLAYYTGSWCSRRCCSTRRSSGRSSAAAGYDGLVMRFLGEKVPAVGPSIGVDRLLAALIHLGRAGQRKATAKVLITNMDPAFQEDYLAMTWELRRAGIPTPSSTWAPRRGRASSSSTATPGASPSPCSTAPTRKRRGWCPEGHGRGAPSGPGPGEPAGVVEERPGQREVSRAGLVAAVRDMLQDVETQQR